MDQSISTVEGHTGMVQQAEVNQIEENLSSKKARSYAGECALCDETSSPGYFCLDEGQMVVICLALSEILADIRSPNIRICTSCRKAMNTREIHGYVPGHSIMTDDASQLIVSRSVIFPAGKLCLSATLLDPKSPTGARSRIRDLRGKHYCEGWPSFELPLKNLFVAGISAPRRRGGFQDVLSLLPRSINGVIEISGCSSHPDGQYRILGVRDDGVLVTTVLLSGVRLTPVLRPREYIVTLEWIRCHSATLMTAAGAAEGQDMRAELDDFRRLLESKDEELRLMSIRADKVLFYFQYSKYKVSSFVARLNRPLKDRMSSSDFPSFALFTLKRNFTLCALIGLLITRNSCATSMI
jgi:hypothetical protein